MRGAVHLIALALAGVSPAVAQSIRVQTWSRDVLVSQIDYPASADLSVTCNETIDRINVFSTDEASLASAGAVAVVGATPNVCLVVGRGGPVADLEVPPIPGMQNWGGLARSGAEVSLWGAVAGTLNGPIAAASIGRFDVGRLGPGSSIILSSGDLSVLSVAQNSVVGVGPIVVLSGRIGRIDVAGDLSITDPRGGIRVRDGIGTITARRLTGSVFANTGQHPLDALPGLGDLISLRCTQFSGALFARCLGAPGREMCLQADSVQASLSLAGGVSGAILIHENAVLDVWSGGTIDAVLVGGTMSCSSLQTGGDIGLLDIGGSLAADPFFGCGGMRVRAGGSIASIRIGGDVGTELVSRQEGAIEADGGIGEFACGSMWGVRLGADSAPLGSVEIRGDLGAVGGRGNATIRASTVNELDVLGSLVGSDEDPCTIRLRSLHAGSVVRVGGSFSADASFEIGETFPGALLVLNASGAGLPASVAWSGQIAIGTEVETIRLSPREAPPHQSPEYRRSSADLGGGSVALAPFRVSMSDCQPLAFAGDLGGSWFPTATDFNAGERDIRLAFYGPIRTPDLGRGIQLWRVNPVTGAEVRVPDDRFDVSLVADRFLRMSGREGAGLAPGLYRVHIPAPSSPQHAIVCRSLLSEGIAVLPQASGSEYRFVLRGTEPCGHLQSFLADWDLDDDADSDDVIAFFTDWEQGEADLDSNSITDWEDVVGFFCVWANP